MPSDLGFDDTKFILPELIQRDHIIQPARPPQGMLFTVPAFGMAEERGERKRTIAERVDFVASLVNHSDPAVIWCHTNDEADRIVAAVKGSQQVAGRTKDSDKIRIYEDFAEGRLRVLVIKPKIGAFGLNWQHCNHVVTFASHSYEQFYQSVRRCWRFGQKRPVRLDVVATEGEERVIGNMRRKAEKADQMFRMLVAEMNRAMRVERVNEYTKGIEVPEWL